MKLFVVLFTFLAVQGWTSARSISEDVDDIPNDILEFVLSSELSNFDVFGYLSLGSFHEFTGTATNPEKCLPYIQDAYDIAVDVRGIVNKAKQLVENFKEGIQKCLGETSNEEKKKCFGDLLKKIDAEGEPIKEAYLRIKPKVIDIMDKFDKCMAGETQEINSQSNPEKCLPYVQEAYNTAVEVRRIVLQAHELGKKVKEGFRKCNAENDPEAKKTCLKDLHKQADAEGKALWNAFLKIRPAIIEVMDKFNNCLA